MNEMDNYFNEMLDKIYDEENNDVLVLKNENGDEIAFEQIALIPKGEKVYLIVKPVQPMEGLGEDEGLVLLINEGLRQFDLVTEENIIDEVFEVYDQLVEEEGC